MQQTYMRRHVMVKAIQFTGKNFFDVQTFISGRKPETQSNYASQKWDEYCQKCTEQGYIEVPSSLGYDPIYQRCTPNDWIVEPEPGVYNVMAPETFDFQFRAAPTADEIKDVSGVNALAEDYGLDTGIMGGYGPLRVNLEDPESIVALQRRLRGASPEFEPGELVRRRATVKAFLPQADVDNLLKDLTIEHERAIGQRDKYLQTGVSTASHGGSHDTCFGFIIAKYVESDIHKKYGLDFSQFMKLDEPVRTSLLSMLGFADVMAEIKNATGTLKLPEGEIPSEVIEGAIERIRSRQDHFPIGVNAPDVQRPQYQGIVAANELTTLMAEPGRWETGASILRGRAVNWHTLVNEGEQVFGTLGVCVGMRRNDKNTVWLDVAFSQNEGESFLVVNNLLATFMFPDMADEHNRRQPQYDELLCCPPQDFERIRELLNYAIEQKEGGRIKRMEGFEAPGNVHHLFEKTSMQGTDLHAQWSRELLEKLFAGITHGLMGNMDGIEDGVDMEYRVTFTRRGDEIDFTSYTLGREPGEHELTVDMLDHIKAVLVKYLNGGYVLSEKDAKAMATHLHYKGGLYYKLFDALHTETQEQMTVYLHLWPHAPGAYARPKLMFESPNEAGQTRFERLR